MNKEEKKSKTKMMILLMTTLVIIAYCLLLITALIYYSLNLSWSLQQCKGKIKIMNLSDNLKINSSNITIMNKTRLSNNT